MSTKHIRERIARSSDPQRGTIPRTTADGLLRACDEDDQANPVLTVETLTAIISAERKRHHNYGPSQMVFNVRCKCGHIGQQVSVSGEFEKHVDEAIAAAVLAAQKGSS